MASCLITAVAAVANEDVVGFGRHIYCNIINEIENINLFGDKRI